MRGYRERRLAALLSIEPSYAAALTYGGGRALPPRASHRVWLIFPGEKKQRTLRVLLCGKPARHGPPQRLQRLLRALLARPQRGERLRRRKSRGVSRALRMCGLRLRAKGLRAGAFRAARLGRLRAARVELPCAQQERFRLRRHVIRLRTTQRTLSSVFLRYVLN